MKMHAKKLRNSNRQYWCEDCECRFDENSLSSIEVVVMHESDLSYLPADSSKKYSEEWCIEEIWRCDDGCRLITEPTIHDELWVCGSCDYKYEDIESAADCCL